MLIPSMKADAARQTEHPRNTGFAGIKEDIGNLGLCPEDGLVCNKSHGKSAS